jgi:hypothetical protein
VGPSESEAKTSRNIIMRELGGLKSLKQQKKNKSFRCLCSRSGLSGVSVLVSVVLHKERQEQDLKLFS